MGRRRARRGGHSRMQARAAAAYRNAAQLGTYLHTPEVELGVRLAQRPPDELQPRVVEYGYDRMFKGPAPAFSMKMWRIMVYEATVHACTASHRVVFAGIRCHDEVDVRVYETNYETRDTTAALPHDMQMAMRRLGCTAARPSEFILLVHFGDNRVLWGCVVNPPRLVGDMTDATPLSEMDPDRWGARWTALDKPTLRARLNTMCRESRPSLGVFVLLASDPAARALALAYGRANDCNRQCRGTLYRLQDQLPLFNLVFVKRTADDQVVACAIVSHCASLVAFLHGHTQSPVDLILNKIRILHEQVRYEDPKFAAELAAIKVAVFVYANEELIEWVRAHGFGPENTLEMAPTAVGLFQMVAAWA